MKSKKTKSLHIRVWFYLIIFSLAILIFLWLFQIVSLAKFYEFSKKEELKNIVTKIQSAYSKEDFYSELDEISYKTNACIQVYSNLAFPYSSSSSNRECKVQNEQLTTYMENFILSNKKVKSYKILKANIRTKTILYGIKLSDNDYAFVNMSLLPVDSTVETLKKQLLYVTVLVLILSFVVAYYLSKRLARPIEEINNSALKLAKGDFNVTFDENSDIEEINALADTLNQARDSLEKTDAIRQELMANVSHDLKTPLTMIKAYAEMVRDLTYKDDKKREENLNVIIEESDRLNLLVNDILDLTKLESKEMKLNYEEFDLNEFIKDIVKTYDIYKEQGYDILYKEEKKMKVYADKKRMQQVMYNLINNAINYTGEDKKVFVEVIKNKDSYRVLIRDTGRGIDKKEIKYIWDKYYKCDKTHSRLYLGTGIGLSIVKNILVQHQFNYGVDSIKNKGTTFYFDMSKR